MIMQELFNANNSDSETELKINKGYADNYNSWRQKEELNKLKTKYGEHIKELGTSEEESSSSDDEDEDGNELTEKFEKNFYKTLAYLKNRDPRIYDENVTFFDDIEATEQSSKAVVKKNKNKEERPFLLRDYERKVMIERNGKFSDSEAEEESSEIENSRLLAPTYVEEQRKLKESFKQILDADEDDNNDKFTLFKPKVKTKEEEKKEEEAYKVWLKGQRTEIDGEEQKELKPLRDFWTDPKLDNNEKFLRDYVLNKKFLDKESDDFNPEYDLVAHDSDENLSEDEKNIETQEEFEHKYNFRFEEPDHEFIKRYPRTLENSLRRKDTRRSEKRVEVKKRKEEEAIRKREELKQLKALKRKEIEEKIEKLKEITGNDDIRFNDIDLDGDFDPAEHDRKMQEMFNDDFYEGPEGDLKPEFPDIDQELEIETTWDKYDPKEDAALPATSEYNDDPHCDDPDFNMDADYDPSKTLQEELIDSSRNSKKKKKRRNKLAVAISKEKPEFDPASNPSYQAYLDQYYALDYEDMIGDQPCRFKYRNVVPNDYGLTVDEIIMADDKELNKWCSLKKALQHRPEYLELNDVRSYQQKASNEALKKKVFRSIYGPKEETEQGQQRDSLPKDQRSQEVKKKKRQQGKGKNKAPEGGGKDGDKVESSISTNVIDKPETKRDDSKILPKKKKRKTVENSESSGPKNAAESQAKTKSDKREEKGTGEPEKKKVRKMNVKENRNKVETEKNRSELPVVKKGPKGQASDNRQEIDSPKESSTSDPNAVKKGNNVKSKSLKKNMKKKSANNKMTHNKVTKAKKNVITDLSAERLKAYGLNPKKFKNKLKYGNKNE